MKRTFSDQLVQQGIAASKASQAQAARRILLQAIELDHDNESAWLWLSGVVESTRERQRCLEQVLKINPGNAHARSGLVWLEQQPPQASFAPSSDPLQPDEDSSGRDNPAQSYLSLGRIFERRHQWDKAQRIYEQALSADESSAAVRFTLGRLLMGRKSFQAAFTYIRRATQLDPEHAGAWSLLGQLYEMAQEQNKAIRAYERAKTLVEEETADSSELSKQAAERLELLRPSLPLRVALNWPETVRQTSGIVLLPAVAALVNARLRPWQIAPLDFLGILLAVLGAYFWVSATAMPRNPGMRAMLGQKGLFRPALRATVGLLGGLFWAIGLLYILIAPMLAWD